MNNCHLCQEKKKTWRSLLIREALRIGLPLVVRNPLSFKLAECAWAMEEA